MINEEIYLWNVEKKKLQPYWSMFHNAVEQGFFPKWIKPLFDEFTTSIGHTVNSVTNEVIFDKWINHLSGMPVVFVEKFLQENADEFFDEQTLSKLNDYFVDKYVKKDFHEVINANRYNGWYFPQTPESPFSVAISLIRLTGVYPLYNDQRALNDVLTSSIQESGDYSFDKDLNWFATNKMFVGGREHIADKWAKYAVLTNLFKLYFVQRLLDNEYLRAKYSASKIFTAMQKFGYCWETFLAAEIKTDLFDLADIEFESTKRETTTDGSIVFLPIKTTFRKLNEFYFNDKTFFNQIFYSRLNYKKYPEVIAELTPPAAVVVDPTPRDSNGNAAQSNGNTTVPILNSEGKQIGEAPTDEKGNPVIRVAQTYSNVEVDTTKNPKVETPIVPLKVEQVMSEVGLKPTEVKQVAVDTAGTNVGVVKQIADIGNGQKAVIVDDNSHVAQAVQAPPKAVAVQEPKNDPPPKEDSKKWIIPTAIAGGAVLVGLAWFLFNKQ